MLLEKDFLTIEEICNKFKTCGNFNFDCDLEQLLIENRYSNLIECYIPLLAYNQSSNGEYLFNRIINISDFKKLLDADIYISGVLNCYIGCFERKIKSYLVEIVCKNLCDAGFQFCDNYDFLDKLISGEESDLPCFVSASYTFDENGKKVLVASTEKSTKLKSTRF